MTYNDLHIVDFPDSKYLPIKVFLVGLFSGLIIKITRKYQFKTGAINSMVKAFDYFHEQNQTILEELKKEELSKDTAIEAHAKTDKILKKFVPLYNSLEKKKFLKNEKLEDSANKALRSFFKVEAQLNAIATADVSCYEEDAPLLDIASTISLGFLQA